MKDKLIEALGGFGIILFKALMFLLIYIPMVVLDFPLLVELILLGVIFVFDFLGGIVCLVLYIWAAVRVFSQPFDILSVIFLIFAALYFLLFVLPPVLLLFKKKDDDY